MARHRRSPNSRRAVTDFLTGGDLSAPFAALRVGVDLAPPVRNEGRGARVRSRPTGSFGRHAVAPLTPERVVPGAVIEGLAGGSLSLSLCLPTQRARTAARRTLDHQSGSNGLCPTCHVGVPYGACACPGWRLAGWTHPATTQQLQHLPWHHYR